MIITLKKDAPKAEVEKLIHTFENKGLSVTMIQGDNYNVFGLVGDTSKIDEKLVRHIRLSKMSHALPHRIKRRTVCFIRRIPSWM